MRLRTTRMVSQESLKSSYPRNPYLSNSSTLNLFTTINPPATDHSDTLTP